MTLPLTPAADLPDTAAKPAARAKAPPKVDVQPVLEKLFALYPQLFGAQFVPLKLGVFQELLAAHPEVFERHSLKAALGWHTRSSRYLQCVAAGTPRHDLQGQVVEPVAPAHVMLSVVELYRRRLARSPQELQAKLRAQLVAQMTAAYQASSMSRADYVTCVNLQDEALLAALDEALTQADAQRARQEALMRAYHASGQTVEAFADMYGMKVSDVRKFTES